MNYPEFTTNHKSLMSKHLKEKIFLQLKDKKTKNDYSLEKLINSGIKNPDSGIGLYAGDEETYSLFSSLIDPVIEEYHSF